MANGEVEIVQPYPRRTERKSLISRLRYSCQTGSAGELLDEAAEELERGAAIKLLAKWVAAFEARNDWPVNETRRFLDLEELPVERPVSNQSKEQK